MVKWGCLLGEGGKDGSGNGGRTGVAVEHDTTCVTRVDEADINGRMTEDTDDDTAPDICCMKGCLAGWTLGIMIFFILPVGIVVTLYAGRIDDSGLLVAGIVLVACPVVFIPVLVVVLLRKKRSHTKQNQSP